MAEIQAVTGAFGFSGSYIASRLLGNGKTVRTLTNGPRCDHPLSGRVEVRPLRFDRPDELTESLRGARVLYNTYWVRFNHKRFTFRQAVANSLALFAAARQAGVARIVHTSVANPSESSPFEYFRGKAQVERGLRECGVPYTILRPAVLFGPNDILINNIAWGIRKFPVFGVFGDGQYRLQPIFVDDFAALAVACGESALVALSRGELPRPASRDQAGALAKGGHYVNGKQNVASPLAKRHRGVDAPRPESIDNRQLTIDNSIDAVGPEVFTYRELVDRLGEILGKRPRVVCMPERLGYAITRVAGWFTGDTILTWEEIGALMADLLVTGSPPVGTTRLTDWARGHVGALGTNYACELARRLRP